MDFQTILPLVFGLIAVIGTINHRFIRLPDTTAQTMGGLLASLLIMAVDALFGLGLGGKARLLIAEIDFRALLMDSMLSLLLFAGAMHVNFATLWSRRWPVLALAIGGVAVSTLVIGGAMHLLLGTSLIAAFLFGALISPTDPVAVMGTLKTVRVRPTLEIKVGGESLLNDGVGVVAFTIVSALAVGLSGTGAGSGGHGAAPTADLGVWALATMATKVFIFEAVGGPIFGALCGWLAYRWLRLVNHHVLEIIIVFAVVTGTYELAKLLHTSGPIAVVALGMVISNMAMQRAMEEKTRQHMKDMWELVDDILNAVLFFFIGVEVFTLDLTWMHLLYAAAAIPVILFARFLSVWPFALLMHHQFERGALPLLVWGGLRGGISVALALSLPEVPEKSLLLAATYGAVVFSIMVQGPTIPLLLRWLGLAEGENGLPGHDDSEAHPS